jgi:hypothetical protein
MRIVICLLLLTGSIVTQAQKNNPQPYANSITTDDLKKHLYIIAGKEMEGRETATEGQRKAAAYIEQQFRALGLSSTPKGKYQLNFGIYQDSLIKTSIEVNGESFNLDKDFAVNPGNNHSSTIMAGEVVFVGNGINDSTRNDFETVNTKGKIIMAWQPSSAATNNARRNTYINALQRAALENSAAAILLVQSNFPRKSTLSKGSQTVNVFKKTIYPNIYFISEQIAAEIMGNDLQLKKDSIKNGNVQPKTYNVPISIHFEETLLKTESSNVLGVLEGTDKKDEYLVITAHYDHLGKRNDSVIYYGADDDGSGTVAVIELAEAFVKAKNAGKGPRRSIIFMAVSGEEKGLWGSAHYSDHPVFPLEKTTANLNIDMIGRTDPKRKQGDSSNYVYVVGDDKLSTDLRPISESVNKKYTKLELDYKYNDPKDTERIYFRSDHYNFARKGVPIIFYFNGTHQDYHRPTDTPDKINYNLLKKRAQLVFYTAWEMANREEMLKRDLTLEIPER